MDAVVDLTVDDVGELRVVDLREALKKRDLPTDGKKVTSVECSLVLRRFMSDEHPRVWVN